jgi:transposase InsO family protein
MTFIRDFWNFQECHLNFVFLADNTKHTPYGKGVVKVYLPNVGERMISNVWYAPTFKKNLLSLVTIRQAGHQMIMEDGLVNINSVKQNMKTMMTGYEDGKLLRMKGIVIPRHFDFAGEVSTGISPIRLWHVRYGHLNFESLSQLQKQWMVKVLPTFKKETAKSEACIYGKQSRESFPTSSWCANRWLKLVHNEVCGPLQNSLGGFKYLLLFIDDFNRMTWVYFLKQKSEEFENFKIFCQLVENEVKEKIGTLRTDNGGEFTSHEFKTYCIDNGIRRNLTNVYTPRKNGVVERMNHTLLGMARSM